MSARLQQLKERADAELAKARTAAEAAEAEKRDMNETEQVDYDTAVKAAKEILDAIKTAKADEAILDEARKLSDEVGAPESPDNLKARVKSLGLTVVESPEFKAMLKQFTTSDGTVRIQDRAKVQSDPIQVKSLFTGASNTSGGAFVVNDRTDIVEMLGRKPLTIRSLCSNRRTTSDMVEFVRQTSHTNAAAPVPEATSSDAPTATADTETGAVTFTNVAGGGYKPQGSWAFEVVQTGVKTIAEWVPATKRALADVAQLEGLINDELRADVAEAEENQLLNGDGSGENFTGILNTSGIQSQTFSTDIVTTVRKGITKAKLIGRVNPNGLVLNPADAEKLDLLQDGNDRYYFGGPFSIGSTPVWGLPVVQSETIAEGTGLMGDFSKAVIWDREQTTVTMTDSHADFFIRNLVAVLAEERLAFGVTRPPGFVKLALA